MTLSSFRVNFNDITFVQGSFHQGDKRFQNTAGMQCTCCSLFSIVFSTSVKSPGHWKADDLDYIIENGDLVYKSLNTESYLMLTELPNNLCLLGSTLTVNYLENRFGFISSTSKTYRFLFKWIMTKSNGLLFMMKGLCISIIWNKKNYFLFDSHSRNSLGQTSPDGSSILLKFSSRKQLEYHIINNYLSEGDVNIQYEVQYIQIVKSNDGIDIKNVYRTLCEKRMHQTSQVRKENFKKIQNETEFQKEKTASSSRVDFYNSSVQGSFHQGDKRFQNTAGKQCTCCSLFSIVFSTLVKSPGHWKAEDLDYIIENGDLVYKSLNTESYLMLTELPTNLCLFESTLTVNYIENRFGFISATSKMYGFLFEKTMTESNGLLFMIKGLCISIIWNRNYFLFDSHSRNSLGQTSPDGSSILLKFSSRKQLESHIINNYLSESDVNIQYEVQYIQIVKSNDDIDIKNLYRILSERKRQTFRVRREKSRIHNASNIQKEKCILPNVSDIHKELKRKSMSTPVGRIKNKRKKPMVVNAEDSKDRVLSFKSAVQEGPCYICVVCNRSLYKRTTKIFCSENYDSSFYNLSTDISSFDDCKYICRTCHSHISKNQIPCQAVWNKLALDDLPDEMQRLNRLEKVLISKRILFKKISILPKGQQPKIKGAICNIPIDVESVSNCLPRATNNNGILFVKLKRKIEFRGHVYFESVRPNCIQEALEYLRQFNPFYSTILINMDNINSELLSLTDANAAVEKNEFSVTLENDEDAGILEVENPSDIEHTNSSEFCIIPNIYNESQNILSIAPGENKVPESFFKEDFCEEQAFPFLLPKGKFGYKVTRSVLLSPVKYFNQRLLNYTQRFASNGDYIFFAHYVMQQINLFNQINVATNKVKGTITAGQLKKNFKSTVRSFISEDKGYMFMKSVKGTPAYWKQFLYDVLAMVRQLGLPTLFFTLSCADLRWKELVLIIAKLNKLNIDECELNYFERCKILNQNPVLTARHFQFRVETFFKEIILHKKGPLGTVDSYVIKVEFQFRGSPHIHSFLWIRDAVQLTKETKDDYIKFVDSIVRADLPDEEGEPELHDLVKKFQIHCHSQSCRKYKNIPCRFHYGRFFTDRTICGEPLGDDISETEKLKILNKRSKLLKKVKAYIDEYLDPHKVTFSPDITIAEILTHLESTEEEYYSSLSIASAEDFEIHLRRPVNSCFVNNYLPIGLQAWEANMDIQPVFNYYKAVSYMCSYFSKCETESSIAMRKVSQESENLGYEDRMRKLAIAFLSHRQCSLQEAVFQVMPELWLRKTYPAVTFANSNFPEKRFRICKSEKEFLELSEDSTDVFKRNNLDRYIDRPNETFKKGKYKILNTMCYAEFLSYYVLDVNPQYTENDSQPEILNLFVSPVEGRDSEC